MPHHPPSLNPDHFLAEMLQDPYYPAEVVKKGQQILLQLCQQLTQYPPANVADLYIETQVATEKFNQLEEEFEAQNSEIETVARECISAEIYNIACAYGFPEADHETLVANRDW